MNSMIRWLLAEEEGQGMVEYALILALIALAAFGVLDILGGKIKLFFTESAEKINAIV